MSDSELKDKIEAAWADIRQWASSRPDILFVHPSLESDDLLAKEDYRACGVCGVRSIPRGFDWPWWKDGRPVHPGCSKKLTKGDTE